MAKFEISCEDCGQPHTAIRKNTKYCRVCRLYRDATYMREWPPVTCTVCDREYVALKREKIPVCGACDPNKWRDEVEGTCVFCEQPSSQLLHEDVKVCRRCSQDPKQRQLFIKALGKKRAQRCSE